MADLKTDYKDDVLDTAVNTNRRYTMTDNGDGTVSFTDVTTYTQNGDSFGSADINASNARVNEIPNQVAQSIRKNIFPLTYTTATVSGVTITNNGEYLSLSGTATADIEVLIGAFYFPVTSNYTLSQNVVASTTGNTNCYLKLYTFLDDPQGFTPDELIADTQSGDVDFVGEHNSDGTPECGIYLTITSGTAATGTTIYPMIRFANVSDGEFVPYAPSNVDLYSDLSNIHSASNIGFGTPIGGYVKIGRMVIVNIQKFFSSTASSGTAIFGGFPVPVSTRAPLNFYNSTTGQFSTVSMTASGQMLNTIEIASNTSINVSGCYLTNE